MLQEFFKDQQVQPYTVSKALLGSSHKYDTQFPHIYLNVLFGFRSK